MSAAFSEINRTETKLSDFQKELGDFSSMLNKIEEGKEGTRELEDKLSVAQNQQGEMSEATGKKKFDWILSHYREELEKISKEISELPVHGEEFVRDKVLSLQREVEISRKHIVKLEQLEMALQEEKKNRKADETQVDEQIEQEKKLQRLQDTSKSVKLHDTKEVDNSTELDS